MLGAGWSEPELEGADRVTWVDEAVPRPVAEPCIVVGGLRWSTSALSFMLASSSPCFMSFYMARKHQKGTKYYRLGGSNIPELELMSHLLLQRQSFPSSPVSGRDISSQRTGPVNLSVKKEPMQ